MGIKPGTGLQFQPILLGIKRPDPGQRRTEVSNHSIHTVLPDGSKCLAAIEHMPYFCLKGQQAVPFLQNPIRLLSLRNVSDDPAKKRAHPRGLILTEPFQ
jgi:hypothetical protein